MCFVATARALLLTKASPAPEGNPPLSPRPLVRCCPGPTVVVTTSCRCCPEELSADYPLVAAEPIKFEQRRSFRDRISLFARFRRCTVTHWVISEGSCTRSLDRFTQRPHLPRTFESRVECSAANSRALTSAAVTESRLASSSAASSAASSSMSIFMDELDRQSSPQVRSTHMGGIGLWQGAAEMCREIVAGVDTPRRTCHRVTPPSRSLPAICAVSCSLRIQWARRKEPSWS